MESEIHHRLLSGHQRDEMSIERCERYVGAEIVSVMISGDEYMDVEVEQK